MIAFIRSKYRASNARNASGSVDSPSSVDPVTSQNNTVTVFRCSRLSPVRGAAQKPQNWKPCGFALPQAGQAVTERVYDDRAEGEDQPLSAFPPQRTRFAPFAVAGERVAYSARTPFSWTVEIPNTVNVLRGEMSLVGPRPLPVRDYSLLEEWHRKRYLVLPGMTGLWQISGRSNCPSTTSSATTSTTWTTGRSGSTSRSWPRRSRPSWPSAAPTDVRRAPCGARGSREGNRRLRKQEA